MASLAYAQDSGGYEGVVPGKHSEPAHLLGKPGERPARVTWPGFQLMPDGRSRIFIQTTVPVTHDISHHGKRIEVRIKDTKLPGSNNKRRVITKYFNTPVMETKLRKHRRDVIAALILRQDVMPEVSTETANTGYYFIYLTFPAGQYVENPQPPPQPPKETVAPGRKPITLTPASKTAPAPVYRPDLDRERPPP